jgi:hypothetical protein
VLVRVRLAGFDNLRMREHAGLEFAIDRYYT